MMADRSIAPLEIFSELYIGDYFADTLQFSAAEHAAFRLLLLHTWLREAHDAQPDLVAIAGVSRGNWRLMAPTILPLLNIALTNIEKWKAALRAYDSMRLSPAEWHIVRTITLERDGYICQYCGSAKRLHVDHKIPLIRGGSNAFANLTTSCGPCNQSKGSKLPEDWAPPLISRERPIHEIRVFRLSAPSAM
jgi:hypothetical protein